MDSPRTQCLQNFLSAVAYTLGRTHDAPAPSPPYNDVARFLWEQHRNLPDYLRLPMRMMSLGFDLTASATHLFHRASPTARASAAGAWKGGRLGFQRDLIRYYESLAAFAIHTRHEQEVSSQLIAASNRVPIEDQHEAPTKCEIAVVGSGPGGAITACLLAEAGRDVVLIEEGAHWSPDSCLPFSREEMLQKYRHGGQTVAFGANKIAYVEGRCVGGGSEINSGLYHRTPEDTLDSWRSQFEVEGLTEKQLRPHFETCEKDLSVSFLPDRASEASLKLAIGARALGWNALEVPRWFRYEGQAQPGVRQSMTRTYLPRFLKAGGKLLTGTRIQRLRNGGSNWHLEACRNGIEPFEIQTAQVFLACGAVHTPALLLRSGIHRNIGQSLQVHPTVKVIGQFPTKVNSADMGVPVHQVKEFAPRISFGCSISSPSYLALSLLEQANGPTLLRESWQQMASYYAMITPQGCGRIRNLAGFRSPLVSYTLTRSDRASLSDGLKKLGELLFAAGAVALYPGLNGLGKMSSLRDLAKLPLEVQDGQANLMTIHLFSSCPMGENRERCATDSFGRVHGYDNLFVSDASLLCSAPGVNPQGTVMALAHRNARAFLKTL